MNNTRKARQVIAEARDLLGGNGILLDFHVMRHMADIEAHPHLRGHRDHPDPHRRTGHHRCRRLRLTGPTIRFVDVDGVRLRTSVRGTGRPLLLHHRARRRASTWPTPFERELDRARRCRRSAFDAPGVGESTRVPACRGACAASPAPWSGWSTRSATTGSTCSASPSAACVAQQLAHQAPERVRRLVLAATGPGLGGVPGSPRVLLALATPRRYYQPDYYRRIAGRIYGGAGPHATPTRCCTARSPASSSRPSLRGYLGQLYAITGWTSLPWLRRLPQPTLVLAGDDDPIVPLVNGRILARLHPRRPAARRARRRTPVPARTARRHRDPVDRVPHHGPPVLRCALRPGAGTTSRTIARLEFGPHPALRIHHRYRAAPTWLP